MSLSISTSRVWCHIFSTVQAVTHRGFSARHSWADDSGPARWTPATFSCMTLTTRRTRQHCRLSNAHMHQPVTVLKKHSWVGFKRYLTLTTLSPISMARRARSTEMQTNFPMLESHSNTVKSFPSTCALTALWLQQRQGVAECCLHGPSGKIW